MAAGTRIPTGVESVLYRELGDLDKELVRIAVKKHRAARLVADSNLPRSNFPVGAAIAPAGYTGGELPSGFNQEERSPENNRHAEETAITRMRDMGYSKIEIIAVALDADVPSPCGNCSQLVWDNSDGLARLLMVDTTPINERVEWESNWRKGLGKMAGEISYMAVAEDMLMRNVSNVYSSGISTLLPRIDERIVYSEIPEGHRKVIDDVVAGSAASILLKGKRKPLGIMFRPHRQYQTHQPSPLAHLIDSLGDEPAHAVAIACRVVSEAFKDGTSKETYVNGDTRHMIRRRWAHAVPLYCVDSGDSVYLTNSHSALPFFPRTPAPARAPPWQAVLKSPHIHQPCSTACTGPLC
jgi:cytidine deaminase